MLKHATLADVTDSRYWQIADYHHVYSRGIATPVQVMKNVVRAIEDTQGDVKEHRLNMLIARDDSDIMKQAMASADRYRGKKHHMRGLHA